MDTLIHYSNLIWAVIWLTILFAGAKVCKLKEWNEDAMSFAQTKAISAFVLSESFFITARSTLRLFG